MLALAPYEIPTSPVAMLGTLTLAAAALVNAYALVTGIAGQRRGRPDLIRSSLHAAWAFTALMFVASGLIVYAFLAHDYSIRYVAHYSDSSMPFFYKITAYWGGLDGSLMFWVWVLSIFSACALYVNRERHKDLIGWVVATIAAVNAFFLFLLLFHKNPFQTFLTHAPLEGEGLNPLLQNYWMVIHPPSLYLGFVGMTIPFAFCIAALASGRLDDAWLRSVRIWVLIPWFFLALGLTLGGIWAYEELGWGGYWAWDPVENAGLLPFLTGTAFLHSVMIQERKGMLKIWNVVLVIATFFLTIFGTFMTRSGVVQSVHAFGEDNQLALLFILFMAAILVISVGLLLYRLPQLRSSNVLESFVSREFAFLLNNWVLLAAAFFVLFATMFPTLSESIMGTRITVGPPFFNKWMIPIGLTLLLLAAIGPLLAWRVTTRRRLVDQFMLPIAVTTLATGLLATIWPRARATSAFMSDSVQLPVALLCFWLVFFSLATVGQEMFRGARIRRKQTGGDFVTALVGVVLTKRRKYGGYIVHIGIALMFFGFAGKRFSQERDMALEVGGKPYALGGLSFRFEEFLPNDTIHRREENARVSVMKGTELVTTLYPAIYRYRAGKQERTTEVAIERNVEQDIYVVLNAYDPESKVGSFKVFLNPLVNWVWLGFGFLAFGTAICVLPERVLALMLRSRVPVAVMLVVGMSLGGALGGARVASAQQAPAVMPAAPTAPTAPTVPTAPTAPTDNAAPAPLDHSHAADVEADTPQVARKLFEDLVCLCGDCKRLTLAACGCGWADRERKQILAGLAKQDLSTGAKEGVAYRLVMAEYRARFGPVVFTVPEDSPFNRLAWLVPYIVFGGALLLVVLLARSWVRRGRAATAGAAGAAQSASAADGPVDKRDGEYDERLDDELRDTD